MWSILYRLYLFKLLTIDEHNPHLIWVWWPEWSLVYQMDSCTETEMTTPAGTIDVEGCFIRYINFTGKTRFYFSEVLIEFISDILSSLIYFPLLKLSWQFDFWFIFIHTVFKCNPRFPDDIFMFSKPMGKMMFFRSPNTLPGIPVVYLYVVLIQFVFRRNRLHRPWVSYINSISLITPFNCSSYNPMRQLMLFTRGQLWPSGIVVACVCLCVCVCVCVSVNHQFVRTITCHPLKLQSPNLDQKCKRPWLRSLLFLGFIDLDLQGQIELKSQNLPHFGLESLSGQ